MADSEGDPTLKYIAWAREHCPVPVASVRAEYEEARIAYDDVEDRLGDDAENDDFLSKLLWMETTIRLAQLGWTVEEFEDARWPVSNKQHVIEALLRDPTV